VGLIELSRPAERGAPPSRHYMLACRSPCLGLRRASLESNYAFASFRHCRFRLYGAALGPGLGVPGSEVPEQLPDELLPFPCAEHDAMVASLVAGRKVDRGGDVRIDMAGRSGDGCGGGVDIQREDTLVAQLVA